MLAAVSTSPPLFARLKSATAAQHAALEAKIDPLAQFRDRATYIAYLVRAHPLYRVVENELARHDWTTLGLDFPSRRKLALIDDDLAVLEASPDGDVPELPVFSNRASAIGALYVLEGATLGGQVISRQLARLGLEPGRGASFFNGYGPRTGAMWQAFQEAAIQGVRLESESDCAVAGARAMFDLFGRWMAR